jgi:myo-inositol 2-dehydrogenase/D-chiro-inositol 1-dehydrogenase
VAASGVVVIAPGLKQHRDYDNAVGIVEFFCGKVAYLFRSRMMAHGQEGTTEIIGTQGKLAVNADSQANLVNTYTSTGINRELPPRYGRFEDAFVQEANKWTTACLENTKLPVKLSGALPAVEIGSYLQEALRTGKKLYLTRLSEERNTLLFENCIH